MRYEMRGRLPKVSIITPCLNSETTIRRTIESVLYQTYSNIEYIIVDGGSKDNTIKIVEEYKALFGVRMTYVSEPDKGIFNAMNKGIGMSHGQIIGIINSDDYYATDTVEKVILHLERDNPYQVIYGYCGFIKKSSIVSTSICTHKNLKRGMIPHPTCFVTRSVYVKYGLFVEYLKIAADYELMMRLVAKDDVRFCQIKSVLAYFSMEGMSNKYRKKAELENTFIRYRYHYYSLKEFIEKLIDIS